MATFRSSTGNMLKRTLNSIIMDETDGINSKLQYTKYFDVATSEDAYEDDLEVAGPGFASDKEEGAEIALGSIIEGAFTRYIHRTFGLKLVFSEEIMEDNKYKQAIDGGRYLKMSMAQTRDMDGALVLARAENSAYVGGDDQPLASASHTLPHGGTFSNMMAVPQTPSRASVIVARAAVNTLPGHNGIRSYVRATDVLCPEEQRSVWEELLYSTKAPDPGNFAAINVVERMGLNLIPVLHWTNTQTNWALKTDAPKGLRWFDRRKPRSKTWTENDYGVMKHAITARWSRGWSDPRCIYFIGS